VERVARRSYGRLVALLSIRSRDIAAAEDSLSQALAAALATWPSRGVPDQPEAWLLTVARRSLGRAARHERVREGAQETIERLHDESASRPEATLPDRRLELLFVCAHPAIDPAVRTPLMLQTVLGLEAARIASAFLVAPAAMAQRLVRAKTKIRDAGVPFAVPEPEELADRLDAVLAAIYAAYGAGWDDAFLGDASLRDLAEEAIFLARILVAALPAEAEARALLALMLHCEARRGARRSAGGAFVPLPAQDTRLWNHALIAEAETLLRDAAGSAAIGRYQIEAAIQSVHGARAVTGRIAWEALVALYDLLVRVHPTVGAEVARAAAVGEAAGAAAGLERLDALPSERVATYQPYWATLAHLRAAAGDRMAARRAYDRAIELSADDAVRAFLTSRRDRA
jgi:RNA polymerase sigma-70 factor (ECF subfamily)